MSTAKNAQRAIVAWMFFVLMAFCLPLYADAPISSVSDGAFHDRQRELSIAFGGGENHRIPSGTLVPHLDFGNISLRYGRFTSPGNQTSYELSFADKVRGTNNNIAVSSFVCYRHCFYEQDRNMIFWHTGIGLMHLRDHVNGQSTKTNFNEELGLAYYHFVDPNTAVTVDYRFYHASNAHLDYPNHGLNITALTIGYAWFFE